jgi:hypothetical protein
MRTTPSTSKGRESSPASESPDWSQFQENSASGKRRFGAPLQILSTCARVVFHQIGFSGTGGTRIRAYGELADRATRVRRSGPESLAALDGGHGGVPHDVRVVRPPPTGHGAGRHTRFGYTLSILLQCGEPSGDGPPVSWAVRRSCRRSRDSPVWSASAVVSPARRCPLGDSGFAGTGGSPRGRGAGAAARPS